MFRPASHYSFLKEFEWGSGSFRPIASSPDVSLPGLKVRSLRPKKKKFKEGCVNFSFIVGIMKHARSPTFGSMDQPKEGLLIV